MPRTPEISLTTSFEEWRQDTAHHVAPASDVVFDTILRAFDQSRDIATNIEHVRHGSVLFAIKVHKSSSQLNQHLWGFWG